MKAYRKRYMQDKDLQTVADELGMSYSTVRKYFSSDEGQRFKEYFSEEERQFLQIQLKQMAEEATRNSLSYISEGKAVAEKSADFARLAKEERQTVKDAIEMTQELGIIDKPKERKEVENKDGGDEIREKLAEYYEEKVEADSDA